MTLAIDIVRDIGQSKHGLALFYLSLRRLALVLFLGGSVFGFKIAVYTTICIK